MRNKLIFGFLVFLLALGFLVSIGFSAECTDSDGSGDPKIRGTTQGTDENGNLVSKTDECNKDNTKVLEYFCINNIVLSGEFACEHGCANGECKRAENAIANIFEGAKEWVKQFYNKNADLLKGILFILKGKFR